MAEKTIGIDHIIGKNIRAERILRGWTQTQVGQLLGVSYQQVNKYEQGVNSLRPSHLMLFSDLFGRPVDSLFYDAKSHPNPDAMIDPDRVEETKVRLIVRYFLRIESPVLQDLVYAVIRIVAAAKQ